MDSLDPPIFFLFVDGLQNDINVLSLCKKTLSSYLFYNLYKTLLFKGIESLCDSLLNVLIYLNFLTTKALQVILSTLCQTELNLFSYCHTCVTKF